MSDDDSVWTRTAPSHALSKRTFIGLLTSWFAFGISLTGLTAYLCQTFTPNSYLIALILFGIVLIIMLNKSDEPIWSFLRFNLISILFGGFLGIMLIIYPFFAVVNLTISLVGCVLLFGLVSTIKPSILNSWLIYFIGVILIGLVIPIFSWLIEIKFNLTATTIWHQLAVSLLSIYILYDLKRASLIERTLDNSIDCAIALYLDIFNLFHHRP